MPRISCPFCNASFEPPPEGRVGCPRCGETVPVRGRETAPAHPAPAPEPPPRSWNLPVALGLAILLGLGFVYWVLNTPFPQPADPPPPPPPIGTPVPPALLRGLDYLPADANVVLAVQVSPVVEHAKRTGQSPFDVLTKAGVPAAALAALGQGGVALPNIDHVAAGANVPDADLSDLRLAVALVLRSPVPDEAKFLDALKAKRPATGSPPHYVAEFGALPLKLTKAADTVWLFGWSERDLTPGGLSPRMRASLTEAIPADAAAWLLTDSADWANKKSVGLLLTLGGKADWQKGLAKVRAVAAGLTVTADPTVRLLAQPATPAARDDLAAAFRRRAGTTSETGEWLYLDAPADGAGGLGAVRDLLAPR
ncbi:hypothetical protein [Urbifossiella limnaea]|uniref:Uncharacterized protein n=1 Tax=Urbifossiella limnaea TaxID=2528023 RepID=A0A517Y0S1_9BACT|nr:hypothetical protein [Urbifossiella limnaea]QDU23360.1 hypothetical protein ETAA1_53590 [Urbifossiella limnaea]